MQTVFVGLSGGVDSSVTALLLKEHGYDVVGVHMKNWSQDVAGFVCPWREDYQDAKRVAAELGIRFELFDFEEKYRTNVVDYMIDEFKLGRTPNPDIMCNQEIKFKLFLDVSLDKGADLIATGHYARVENNLLYKAVDDNKDQTYFLYRITDKALQRTLMPIGSYHKPEVRRLAQKYKLTTADKKESMGICFVGKVGIREFLSEYVETEPGSVIDIDSSLVIGQHEGAIFYTIGQRHGLRIGGGLPYYVVGKDMDKNVVYVSSNLDHNNLWRDEFELTSVHIINQAEIINKQYEIRTRHRSNLVKCRIEVTDLGLKVKADEKIRAITPGQSAVIYEGDLVIGGGIIA